MNYLTFAESEKENLVTLRRDFHRHPEPGWLEYRTAAKVADTLEELGYELAVGEEVLALDSRMGLPSKEEAEKAMHRALEEGANPKWVEKMAYGKTAIVATLHFSEEGPVVAFRADMDANDVQETSDEKHIPVQENFVSCHANAMHACGHDAHSAMLLTLAKYIVTQKDAFKGTVKLIFQPAEEGVRGARAMRDAGVVDDVDYLFGLHVGLSADSSHTLACQVNGFLATSKLDAVFKGVSAHAGASPEQGKNALLAACTAALNLQAISRTSEGASRINVGVLNGGTGRNVLPDIATLKLETRGETTAIDAMMKERAIRILEGAAAMQDVEVTITEAGSASGAVNSQELADLVHEVAKETELFHTIIPSVNLGGSEDCAYFMEKVDSRGGQAVYICLGMNLVAPHHNSKFDVDEEVLPNGVALLGALANKLLTK